MCGRLDRCCEKFECFWNGDHAFGECVEKSPDLAVHSLGFVEIQYSQPREGGKLAIPSESHHTLSDFPADDPVNRMQTNARDKCVRTVLCAAMQNGHLQDLVFAGKSTMAVVNSFLQGLQYPCRGDPRTFARKRETGDASGLTSNGVYPDVELTVSCIPRTSNDNNDDDFAMLLLAPPNAVEA